MTAGHAQLVYTAQGALPRAPMEPAAQKGRWWTYEFSGPSGSMTYLTLYPDNYNSGHAYPLCFFLHPQGAEGQVPNVLDSWVNTNLAFRAKHPAVIVAPLCPNASDTVNWGGLTPDDQSAQDNAVALARHLISILPIDPGRVYLTGYSMGGLGTWDTFIKHYKSPFTAALPISGADYCQDPTVAANELVNAAIWSIHGGQDTEVPPDWDRRFHATIQQLRGLPLYTEDPSFGHAIQDYYYSDPKTFNWLFSQQA